MSASTWVVATQRGKLPRKDGVVPVYPKGVAVLLVKHDDELHAVANRCAHMSCPLESGRLEAHVLTCPCHDWRFDVRTGAFMDAPELHIPTYALKYDGDDVLLELPEG